MNGFKVGFVSSDVWVYEDGSEGVARKWMIFGNWIDGLVR